ncbi:uncharacterized protein LOC144597277 isoform X2 [Rhinoraja longicauda]
MDASFEGDWKLHARLGWERLQTCISGAKQRKSESAGHNKVNSSLCVRSKSAPVTHSTNNGQVQMNRRAVCFVKKTPKYHLHRRHNIKYWYEEPTIGMGKKPQTMGTYGTFLGICDPLRK